MRSPGKSCDQDNACHMSLGVSITKTHVRYKIMSRNSTRQLDYWRKCRIWCKCLCL